MTKTKVYSMTTGDVFNGKKSIPASADAFFPVNKGFSKRIGFQTFSEMNDKLYSLLAKQIMNTFEHAQAVAHPDPCAMRVGTTFTNRTFVDFVVEHSTHEEFRPYTRNQLVKHVAQGYNENNPVTLTLGHVVYRLYPDFVETTIPSDDVEHIVQHMELLSIYLGGVTGRSWLADYFDGLDEFLNYSDGAPSQSVFNSEKLVTALRKLAEEKNANHDGEFYSERTFEGDFVLISNHTKDKVGDFRAVEYTAKKHHVIEVTDEFDRGAMIFPTRTKVADITVNRNQVFSVMALNVGKYNDIKRWMDVTLLDDKGKEFKVSGANIDTFKLIDLEARHHVLDNFIKNNVTFISSKAVELTK